MSQQLEIVDLGDAKTETRQMFFPIMGWDNTFILGSDHW